MTAWLPCARRRSSRGRLHHVALAAVVLEVEVVLLDGSDGFVVAQRQKVAGLLFARSAHLRVLGHVRMQRSGSGFHHTGNHQIWKHTGLGARGVSLGMSHRIYQPKRVGSEPGAQLFVEPGRRVGLDRQPDRLRPDALQQRPVNLQRLLGDAVPVVVDAHVAPGAAGHGRQLLGCSMAHCRLLRQASASPAAKSRPRPP